MSRLFTISFSRAFPAIKRAFFAAFLLSFTDYGINLMLSGTYKTVALSIYHEIIGKTNFNSAAIIAIFLWIPLIILYFICIHGKTEKFQYNVKGTNDGFYLKKRGRYISFGLLLAFMIIILLPIITFISSSLRPTNQNNPDILQNYLALTHLHIERLLGNSIIIAFWTTIFGTVFTFLTAYITSKTQNKMAKILRWLAILPFSLPGLAIGIGFAMAYSPYTTLYRTYLPLILANTIHFFGVPYLLFYNNFSSMNNEIEITAKVFRIEWYNTLFRIYLPQMKQTIVETMLFYFVNSMITISAVVILFRTDTKPLAIQITQFEAQLLIYYAATVTVIILFVNIIIKTICYYIPVQKNDS